MSFYPLDPWTGQASAARKKKSTQKLIELSKDVKWRHYIFPDFTVVYGLRLGDLSSFPCREYSVSGFELYIVEQWVYERRPTVVIVSYTGSKQDVMHGIRITLPEDLNMWPEDLSGYYQQLASYCTLKDIDAFTSVFITDLSQFPSTLNLLHVEFGNMKDIWFTHKVNFNLKRLKCIGRSALSLADPPDASLEKFLQLYMLPMRDKDQAMKSVVTLITLVQISLWYFELLRPEYKDGIYCKHTDEALDQWWSIYGTVYLGIDRPRKEGSLGPSTICGLISFVLSCYFKFVVKDVSSLKDPFDEESFRTAVYNFQKKHGLEKTSFLNFITVTKLFEVSSKISNTDIFKFRKVVKSTVQDIAGKGNPIQLSSEILTTDLSKLISHLQSGGYIKAFWKAKLDPECHFPKVDFTKANYDNTKYFIDPVENFGDKPGLEVSAQSNSSNNIEHTDLLKVGECKVPLQVDTSVWTKHMDIIDTVHFQEEIFRRASFSSVKETIGTGQLTCNYKDKCLSRHKLQRSSSFSIVEDVAYEWTMPFEPSVVRIAREIMKAQSIANSRFDRYSGDYKIVAIKSGILRIGNLSNQINVDMSTLQSHQNMLLKKHEHLQKSMQELDSLAARFNYDIRILDIRMRDINESISQLGSKLQKVENYIKNHPSYMLDRVDTLKTTSEFEKEAQRIFELEKTRYNGLVVGLLKRVVYPQLRRDWSKSWMWRWLFRDHIKGV
ncbi:uncharacterized protein Ecym_5435 [Eremothecium cymbalariae DBVPG|uniref:STB6-like N-terminal domain-containing protein n=1 Tax=Eremothecium cymbalariae (strain CBS 270.75 / DBVPG 7215 / KCTC 17166 / NRRL Y-17582) TaxID=931890 RepID=I6NDP5_ERECY|nr:hypothetical protein Ecym_5435 [Eremothecium cymbalariae DBVPG\